MKRIALILVSALSALGAAELAGRALDPAWVPSGQEQRQFWRHDARLGWTHVPGRRGTFSHPDFSVTVAINESGMRDSVYPVAHTGRKRMLVIGDSYGWGFGVELDQRFSEILERNHDDWEIINASVSAYSTDQELLLLQDAGRVFTPDVVLLLVCENDFDGNLLDDVDWYFKPRFAVVDGGLRVTNVPVPEASPLQRWRRSFRQRTHLAESVSALVARFQVVDAVALAQDARNERAAREVTSRLLARIHEVATEQGARVVVVSVPMDDDRRHVLAETTSGRDIPFLPLDASFAAQREPTSFPHDFHWNAAGHAVAAAAIDRFLRESGTWTEGPARP